AFMHTLEDARELSRRMVSIGKLSGRRVIAVLADMNQPLGSAVGNSLEVCEAVETLHGGGPADFRAHCLTLASYILVLGGKADNLEEAHKTAEETLASGKAFDKFHQLVEAQGGDTRFIDDLSLFPRAKMVEPVLAERSGYLAAVNAKLVGEAAVILGAGRAKKGDPVDHAVGMLVHHKVGDRVERGERLFTIHANDAARLEQAQGMCTASIGWSNSPTAPLPLFYEAITAED
ncbi:MAG TPA: pyrimidine-nucleoside phosphorylase, partial [Anaerolineaceae bacterium]